MVKIHFSRILIKTPKYTVVCKPNSHSLSHWFYTEGRAQIGPGWLDMIISLYWSQLQTVHLLGIVNDKPTDGQVNVCLCAKTKTLTDTLWCRTRIFQNWSALESLRPCLCCQGTVWYLKTWDYSNLLIQT